MILMMFVGLYHEFLLDVFSAGGVGCLAGCCDGSSTSFAGAGSCDELAADTLVNVGLIGTTGGWSIYGVGNAGGYAIPPTSCCSAMYLARSIAISC